jgi:hypothetical protein
MGTKKKGHFGKNFLAPGGSYITRRERGFADPIRGSFNCAKYLTVSVWDENFF